MTAPTSDEIHYLFRFRDLVAKTIEAHKEVIKQHRACWWGWWKRPTEGARMEIWDKLHEEASPERPVKIGLFDSGRESVYLAWVTNVIKPAVEESGSPSALQLLNPPEDETDLVPEYYRHSPFSRAWMRLVKIEDKPIKFFGKYAFDEAPSLDYYRQEVLERFRNKVIKNADELRGMDTTIWSVRPRRDRDAEEEIVLTTKALTTPISYDSVDLSSNNILHITDLHFAIGNNRDQHVWRLESEDQDGRNTLAEAIIDALGEKRVGLIVVTGDLTFTGKTEEFNEARLCLQRLRGLFDIDQDHLVVIPGNHDIQWATDLNTYTKDAAVERAEEEAKKNYKDFYFKLFEHEADVNLSMGRRFQLPCGIALEVGAVNSSALKTGRDFLAGMGFVEKSTIQKLSRVLRWDSNSSLALRVLAIHHHLDLTEDLEPFEYYYRGFGIASDALKIRRMSVEKGVTLALHGHKHRPFVWRSSVYEAPEKAQLRYQLGSLSILGGGSVGSKETEAKSNYFNLIDISSAGIDVTLYRSAELSAFSEVQRMRAKFELEENPPRLALGDWIFPNNHFS